MEILEWRSQDPALLSMPEVKSVKKEIAALKLELQQAEDKLEALETVGSPRDTWERALIDAESTLHGITNGLPVSRLRDHLESMYGTSDFNRLPKEAIVIAKANPEVVRTGMVKFAGRLDSLKDFHTDMELQRSYTAIEAAIAGTTTSSTDKLILETTLRTDQQDKIAATQLKLQAEQVERPRVLVGAAAQKTTARSRRNTVVIAALIGLILGALAALLWDSVVPRLTPRNGE